MTLVIVKFCSIITGGKLSDIKGFRVKQRVSNEQATNIDNDVG